MANRTKDTVSVSFEFVPPHSSKMAEDLWRSIDRLAILGPSFVSVTYGADGSTRERTHTAVARIVRDTDLTAAPHLTCVDASRGEIDDIAREYWDMGVRHVGALRGDLLLRPPGLPSGRSRRLGTHRAALPAPVADPPAAAAASSHPPPDLTPYRAPHTPHYYHTPHTNTHQP